MESFTRHTGVVVPLDRADVDTDQIVPARFLRRVERTGFGQFLFLNWRLNEDGTPKPDFELNQPMAQEKNRLRRTWITRLVNCWL